MKKTIRAALLVSAAVFLAACDPTIDGSTKENFEKSVDKMRESMSAEERSEFNGDMRFITGRVIMQNIDTPSLANDKLIEIVDGKDVEDISEIAAKMRAEKK